MVLMVVYGANDGEDDIDGEAAMVLMNIRMTLLLHW